ncbi:ogr/Delta-like zinc finger family protein [Serratia microhaemolytica]|uniref:ogr/Delta-like zinc finger family protein n=1 Tax=Serratia microhaemolytica TaxID=2675110 RepID=UPI000FDD4034|nr:ogr/Delta-like zinc finger family protein [Serratia microhaemolytica]
MAMRCPRCRATAKTRTSVELSVLVRRSYHQCQNMLCGYCFTSMTEIDGALNQTQPVAGATLPQELLPPSHQGESAESNAA